MLATHHFRSETTSCVTFPTFSTRECSYSCITYFDFCKPFPAYHRNFTVIRDQKKDEGLVTPLIQSPEMDLPKVPPLKNTWQLFILKGMALGGYGIGGCTSTTVNIHLDNSCLATLVFPVTAVANGAFDIRHVQSPP